MLGTVATILGSLAAYGSLAASNQSTGGIHAPQDVPPDVPTTTAPAPPATPQPNASYFNPQISLIADFRGALSHPEPSERKGRLQEVEIGLASDIDPFLRAEAYIGFHTEDGESHAEVEEAFGTYTRFGKGFQLKVGKIAGAIGRTNRNHVDQLAYLDYPFVIQDLLGEEGLRAPGASLSYLFPGEQFHELTLEYLDPEDGPLFQGSDLAKALTIGRYRTFFDFSEDLSAQLGASLATGRRADRRASLYGTDFTMKWSPGRKGRSALFETEAYWATTGMPGERRSFGAFAAITYEVMPRWFLHGKFDYSEIPGGTDIRQGVSVGATFKMTEYQHWRLEFRRIMSNFAATANVLQLQFQFAMGPHPAHKY